MNFEPRRHGVTEKNNSVFTCLRGFFLILLLLPFSLSAQNTDIRWLRNINHPVNPGLDRSMRVVSSSIVPMAVGAATGFYLYNRIGHPDGRYGEAPLVIAGSMIMASGISLGLKYAVNRPRPFVTYGDIEQRTNVGPYSFPSSHTANAFALATTVSMAAPKWYIIVPSYAWACTVAYSRMRLGVHYPTDVLAGALIGSGSAWLTWKINDYLWSHAFKQKPQPIE